MENALFKVPSLPHHLTKSFFSFKSHQLSISNPCTMRIRHEYKKREAQKPPQDQDSTKICHCNTLVLIVDKTHHAVYRDHFNHCPSKSSNVNLVAPDVLQGSTNWQVMAKEEPPQGNNTWRPPAIMAFKVQALVSPDLATICILMHGITSEWSKIDQYIFYFIHQISIICIIYIASCNMLY